VTIEALRIALFFVVVACEASYICEREFSAARCRRDFENSNKTHLDGDCWRHKRLNVVARRQVCWLRASTAVPSFSSAVPGGRPCQTIRLQPSLSSEQLTLGYTRRGPLTALPSRLLPRSTFLLDFLLMFRWTSSIQTCLDVRSQTLWPVELRGPLKGPRGPLKGPRGHLKGPRSSTGQRVWDLTPRHVWMDEVRQDEADSESSASDKIRNLERKVEALSGTLAVLQGRVCLLETFVRRCTQCFGGRQ